jgi:hypothetical protein
MTYDSEMFSHYYWYDTAQRLKYSSDVLYEKLSVLDDRQMKMEDMQEVHKNRLAIFQSHMMLLGFAVRRKTL